MRSEDARNDTGETSMDETFRSRNVRIPKERQHCIGNC